VNPAGGTLVLDSQGLSGWLAEDRRVMTLLAAGHRSGADVAASAMTILEAAHRGVRQRRLDWVLSRLRVEPVTQAAVRAAARLLLDAGLHGHAHAIDAVVAELAARLTAPVALVTSDPGDMRRLCPAHVRIVAI
jgi:predicted nucleic acid-binding protein